MLGCGKLLDDDTEMLIDGTMVKFTDVNEVRWFFLLKALDKFFSYLKWSLCPNSTEGYMKSNRACYGWAYKGLLVVNDTLVLS